MDKLNDYGLSRNFQNFVSDEKENISFDLVLDTFQNLILDCKSLSNSTTNKYLTNFYKQNEKIYNKLLDCRMNYSNYNVLKIIGQGAFGQVQLVRHKQNGDLFALKILNKSQVMNCEGTVFWQEERDIMMKINSIWIVKLHYAFQDSKRLYMVMDYLPGGNLVTWMSKVEDLLEKDVCFYAAEIVLAINALHNYGFVHRDIKPDNFLIDMKGHIKLADFGSCVKMDPLTKFVNCNRAIGTPDYISPEVLLSQSDNTKYGKEVDWWALGVMLFEIFYGEPPFYSDNLINTYGKIMTHEQSLSFPQEEDISEMAIDFMKKLICDRSIRLGQTKDANDIKSHNFFTQNPHQWDWDTIQNNKPPFVPLLENDLDTTYFDFGEEDIDKNFMIEGNQELKPTSFTGENLQFSGFSYTQYQNGTSDMNKENLQSDLLLNSNIPNEDRLHNLSKENENNKNALDKLLIEKKDLENQLHVVNNNLKKEELISKKLQIDYSELITKHSFSQKKIEELEGFKEKLSLDLLKLQESSTQEKERLLLEISKLENHFKSNSMKLMEIQTEFHKSKLRCVKLESEYNTLKEAHNLLETDLVRLRNSKSLSRDQESSKNNNDYVQLLSDYESKEFELQKSLLENKCLSKSFETLQTENEKLSFAKVDLESKLSEKIHDNRKHETALKEKNDLIDKMKVQIDQLQTSLDESDKNHKTMNMKLTNIMKMNKQDKSKYEQEMEEQRNKLSKIITAKTFEIQKMKTSMENLQEINNKLNSQVEMDKIKQETLVAKINEIIHGTCKTAQEMMISEDLKKGYLGKRSGRMYHQLAKENKRLESIYEELQKNTKARETELRKQIDSLIKEKEQSEAENISLQEHIRYYENLTINESFNNRASVSTIASSHGSFDSGLPQESQLSQSRRSIKAPFGKPPLLNHSSLNASFKTVNNSKQDSSDVFFDNNDEKYDIRFRQKKSGSLCSRQSKSESLSMDLPHNEQLLEVNVKIKGKKMSWEKRFIKFDDQYLYFYGEDFVTCHLKILFSSLAFVRSVTLADVIHAKKTEISRIFQICYDKNENLYLEAQIIKSLNKSSSSINSLESGKSTKTNSSNDNDVTVNNDKKEYRKNSLTKFFPSIILKNNKSKENHDFSSALFNRFPIFIKGHLFITVNIEGKLTCELCQKPFTNNNCAGPENMTNQSKTASNSSKIITDISQNNNHMTSVMYPDKNYQCYHCSLFIHGYDLNSKLYNCKDSHAIQLCRASSESAQINWIKSINTHIKSQTKSFDNHTGMSTPKIQPRSFDK